MAAAPVPQSYATHRRYVPGFHFLTAGILVLNLFWAVVRLVRNFPLGTFALLNGIMGLLVAVALLLLFFYTRQFALTVQDRVIRLEETSRVARLCPDLGGRLEELTPRQLIALRFASDQELPDLVRRVLDERITDGNVIKKAIRTWRADEMRA
jgi:Family of unknown function (DUF6526)